MREGEEEAERRKAWFTFWRILPLSVVNQIQRRYCVTLTFAWSPSGWRLSWILLRQTPAAKMQRNHWPRTRRAVVALVTTILILTSVLSTEFVVLSTEFVFSSEGEKVDTLCNCKRTLQKRAKTKWFSSFLNNSKSTFFTLGIFWHHRCSCGHNSLRGIQSIHHPSSIFLWSSTAHSNSVLTFPNNIYMHTC